MRPDLLYYSRNTPIRNFPIRRQILIGHLAVGEQIESVKSLSARLKINPMTVSKAYGFLVEEGLLERRRGVGLFVRSIRKDVKRRQQDRMLDRAMSKVAALAVQMGIPEEGSGAPLRGPVPEVRFAHNE